MKTKQEQSTGHNELNDAHKLHNTDEDIRGETQKRDTALFTR